jgi:hypothetical protein
MMRNGKFVTGEKKILTVVKVPRIYPLVLLCKGEILYQYNIHLSELSAVPHHITRDKQHDCCTDIQGEQACFSPSYLQLPIQ